MDRGTDRHASSDRSELMNDAMNEAVNEWIAFAEYDLLWQHESAGRSQLKNTLGCRFCLDSILALGRKRSKAAHPGKWLARGLVSDLGQERIFEAIE